MLAFNSSFITDERPFIEWVAATGIANQLNTFQIPVKYIVYAQFMVANSLLKNTVSIEEWMTAVTFVKYRNSVP